MPKSKNRKNHKQKVAARNLKISQEKKKREKIQREFIMNLIKQEQERGLFDKNLNLDGPVLDGPVLDGPVLDGPVLDGPVLESPISEVDSTDESKN